MSKDGWILLNVWESSLKSRWGGDFRDFERVFKSWKGDSGAKGGFQGLKSVFQRCYVFTQKTFSQRANSLVTMSLVSSWMCNFSSGNFQSLGRFALLMHLRQQWGGGLRLGQPLEIVAWKLYIWEVTTRENTLGTLMLGKSLREST